VKQFPIWLLWVVLSTTLFSANNTLKSIEVKHHELHLHFSAWLDSNDIHHMTLENPHRQVIDIKNARLSNRKVASGLSAKGVRSFRVAQYRNDTIRIVIETDRSYHCRGYQPMALRTLYRIPLPQNGNSKPEAKTYTKKVKKVPAKRVRRTPEVVKKAPPRREMIEEEEPSVFSSFLTLGSSGPRRSYTIVVDAGHGGHDSGAIGVKRYYEKRLVLQIAKRVEKQLKKRGFRVKMTRTTDRFIKLRHRTHFANQKKADIFVSIHANAIANRRRFGKVYGVETYFLQLTRSAKAQRIAAKENSVVLDKNDHLSKNVILKSVLSGPKIELSHKLAIDVQKQILKRLRQKYKGVKNGGVKPAPFWVLVGAQMPSILVEVGYITNPIERRRLYSPDYQKRIAKGIADGVSNYLTLREKEFD